MAVPTRVVPLRRSDRERLEQWLRTRTAPHRQVERARIVLGSADGNPSYELAEVLGLSRPTVQRWLDRYEAQGIRGLEDRPRSGRPRTVTPEVEEEVVVKTTQEDPPQGTHWSTRIMAEETGLHHSRHTDRRWAQAPVNGDGFDLTPTAWTTGPSFFPYLLGRSRQA